MNEWMEEVTKELEKIGVIVEELFVNRENKTKHSCVLDKKDEAMPILYLEDMYDIENADGMDLSFKEVAEGIKVILETMSETHKEIGEKVKKEADRIIEAIETNNKEVLYETMMVDIEIDAACAEEKWNQRFAEFPLDGISFGLIMYSEVKVEEDSDRSYRTIIPNEKVKEIFTTEELREIVRKEIKKNVGNNDAHNDLMDILICPVM